VKRRTSTQIPERAGRLAAKASDLAALKQKVTGREIKVGLYRTLELARQHQPHDPIEDRRPIFGQEPPRSGR
jgi:hypothetical protein